MTSCIGNVGFLIKLADDLFKHRSHSVIVQCGLHKITLGIINRAIRQVHRGIRKLADQQAQNVMLREFVNLISEFKALDNILHILRKTVQVKDKVGFQLLLISTGFQI